MAVRRAAALDIWMNGVFVGQWQRSSGGQDVLVYAPEWMADEQGRPLSLSLPFGGSATLRGAAVAAYFDNLIPDNEQILRRLQERHRLRSTEPSICWPSSGETALAPSSFCPKARGRTNTVESKPKH